MPHGPLGWCWVCIREIAAGTKQEGTRQPAAVLIEGTSYCSKHAEDRAYSEKASLDFAVRAFSAPRPPMPILPWRVKRWREEREAELTAEVNAMQERRSQ